MRLCRLLVLFLVVLALAACARAPARKVAQPRGDLDALMYGTTAHSRSQNGVASFAYPSPPSPTVSRVTQVMPAEEGPYVLDSGDKLRIVVFGQDTLSNTYTVDAAGMVTMPLIGAVQARGVTTAQLSGAIAGRLKASFIRDPSVAVEVDTYRPFFVLGEVTYPGQYPFVPNMTVQMAVAIAGGFTPRASKDKVTVTRKVQDYPAKFALPLQGAVRPGDTITVGERWF